MGQPDILGTFSSVSVEGFDQIYQSQPTQVQSGLEQTQIDLALEVQSGPDREIQPDPSQGVSLEEAAKVLSLHVDTVRKRLQKGKIKGFKVADKFGDKWLVHKDEIERARPVQPHPANHIQGAPAQAQPQPMDQAQHDPDEAQTDPIIDIEIGPEPQAVDPTSIKFDPERERLMQIIESQAHQLKAAGDVIMYLRSEVDDAKNEVKLLTDSQHRPGWWSKFCSWFVGR